MVAKIISAILKLIVKVASILLAPIDLAISGLFPDFSDVLIKITEYMSLPFQFMGWIFELVHIPSICLVMLVAGYTIKNAIVGGVASVKYAITLYQRFKP